MIVFAHHADAFLEIEVLGRKFPDGMAEHTLAFGLAAVVMALLAYGAFAAIRDLRRWRRNVTAA